MTIDYAMNHMPEGIDAVSVTKFRRDDGTFFWSATIHSGRQCYGNGIRCDSSSFQSVYADCLAQWRRAVPDDALVTAFNDAADLFNAQQEASK